MKFRYDKANWRMVTDDPEIWVEYWGPERERGKGFVLAWKGKRIGFREPDNRVERVPNGDNSRHVWTIGEVGDDVRGWDDDREQEVYKARAQKFHSREELQEVLGLVVDAMSVFSGRHETLDPDAIEVHFSHSLELKIESGELIGRM
jgi:hypothetical protein